MSIKDFESVFTRKQFENIYDNLRAYLTNFGYLKGENIFFGDCACSERQVAEWIKLNVGEFNPDCWMGG